MTANLPFPAPGSDVPGAPPPLRRATTPDDGTLLRRDSQAVVDSSERPRRPDAAHGTAATDSNGYLIALGLLTAAVAIELDTRLRRRRPSRSPSGPGIAHSAAATVPKPASSPSRPRRTS